MATFILTAASEAQTGTSKADIFDGHNDGDGIGVTGGIDTLNGGSGNDQFLLDSGSAGSVVGGGATDTVRLFGSNLGTTSFASVEVLDAVSANFSASFSQLLAFGSITNSALAASQLGITLTGTAGTIDFSTRVTGAYSLAASAAGLSSAVTVSGSGNGDLLTGSSLADRLAGLAGNDALDGLGGADTLIGGLGNDLYRIDNAGDIVSETAGEGPADQVISSLGSYALAANADIELLSLASGSNGANLTGNTIAQMLTGNNGANTLDGAGGADTLQGLLGNDVYLVDNAGDVIVEALNGGNDRLVASVSYQLGADAAVETLVTDNAAGTAAIDLTGNGLSQTLVGNNGDNRLSGGIGADTLQGLLGNDTYLVDGQGDVIFEGAGQGSLDRIAASGSYVLAAGIDIERLQTQNGAGTAAIDLAGNELDQSLVGNNGDNVLDGKGGADTMLGHAGNDTYVVDNAGDVVGELAGEGSDTIVTSFTTYTLAAGLEIEGLQLASGIDGPVHFTGNEFGQRIVGSQSGQDVLIGSSGDDTLVELNQNGNTLAGGSGDDTYSIGNGPDNPRDVIEEAVGNGIDTIVINRLSSTVGYALASNLEIEVLSVGITPNDSSGMRLVGNEFAQILIGSLKSDTLDGGGGADTLEGGGGQGVDTYIVDSGDDVVITNDGDGIVNAETSFALSPDANIRLLRAVVAGNINLTGSDIGQMINGNNDDNRLDGRGGADSLFGGVGNDTFIVDSVADVIDDTAGFDVVATSVSLKLGPGQNSAIEVLKTVNSASTAPIDLTGNFAAQSVLGNAGDNHLDGRTESDTLTGGAGADTFVFSTILGINNVDTIADFSVADDTMQLSHAVFAALPVGGLAASALQINFTGHAEGPNDRIVYENDTGNLFYDSDGTGSAAGVQFATLTPGLALTNADFIVV